MKCAFNCVKHGHSNLMDEVLHFGLDGKPVELDCDQFVGAHPWTVSFINQLFLSEQQKNDKTYNPSLFKA